MRHTYSVLTIATRHPALFSAMIKPTPSTEIPVAPIIKPNPEVAFVMMVTGMDEYQAKRHLADREWLARHAPANPYPLGKSQYLED